MTTKQAAILFTAVAFLFFHVSLAVSYRINLLPDDDLNSAPNDDDVAACRLGDLVAGTCIDRSKVKVTSTTEVKGTNGINCTEMTLEAADCSVDEVELCYNLNVSGHWYGGNKTIGQQISTNVAFPHRIATTMTSSSSMTSSL